MRVLVCGAEFVARELLKRLGDGWSVTLIDSDPDRLERTAAQSPCVEKTLQGDPSSPVLLDRVEAGNFDYILALTDDDDVNLAVCKYVAGHDNVQVSALTHNSDLLPQFRKLGVNAVSSDVLLSKRLYNYLQDPRMQITSLQLGHAAVYEISAADHFRVVGKRSDFFHARDRRLAALFRKDKLIFPTESTAIRSDDKLIILGHPDIFESVCDLLECGHPHFPLAYGQTMAVALSSEKASGDPAEEYGPLLNESLFLAQNTQIKRITMLCAQDECNIRNHLEQWPQDVEIDAKGGGKNMLQRLLDMDKAGSLGLAVVPARNESLLSSLFRRSLISFAHELECPLLAARHTAPYEKILVPFNGSPKSELALEVAVDIARQLGSSISVAVVEMPEFITGSEESDWAEEMLERVKELAHIHKIHFNEIVRHGNPVKEITALTQEHDLLVLGSSNSQVGLLSPNVGDFLLRKAHCSVLVVAN